MKFVRENYGRIIFLILYLVAVAIYVYINGNPAILGGDPAITKKAAAVFFKLVTALFVLYLFLLLLKEYQDRQFKKAHTKEELKYYGGMDNGSVVFNVICAVLVLAIYIGMNLMGLFA